jgi:HK97 family phage major capsid protein
MRADESASQPIRKNIMTIDHFNKHILPLLRSGATSKEDLQKRIAEFQKDETISDAEGNPVEIEAVFEQPKEQEQKTEEQPQQLAAPAEREVTQVDPEQLKQIVRSAIKTELDNQPTKVIKMQTDKRISIPRSVHRPNLRAFRGEDAYERAYKAGMFFLASNGNRKAIEFCERNDIETRDATIAGATDGANLVYDELVHDLINLVEQFGVFRRNALVYPMAQDTASYPKRTGGMTADWANEGATEGASDPTFTQVDLNANKLSARSKFSDELNEDAVISYADHIVFELAQAFAVKEDSVAFGSGTSGTFVGIQKALTDVASNAGIVNASGNLYSEVLLKDFEAVIGTLPEYPGINASWFVSKLFWGTVMEPLAMALGGVTYSEATGPRKRSFLGYPVEITQSMPKTEANSQLCAVFGDLHMGSILGERRQVQVKTSDQVSWATDQIDIKASERIAIVHHDVGTSSQAGAIVGLRLLSS